MSGITQMMMSVEQWADVQDNPKQRNTELHAKKARSRHLRFAAETQARVSAAMLPSGDLYKLDGHTRSLLWSEGSLPGPRVLYVDVYSARDTVHVGDLYEQFDSSTAAESASDKLHGAYRLNGFNPQSGLVLFGGVVTAMKGLAGYAGSSKDSVYGRVSFWLDEIRRIDRRMYSHSRFQSGLIAAMIISVAKDGDSAFSFWDLYNEGMGVKRGRERDPVQALIELVEEKRIRKQMTGTANIVDLLGKAISCYEMHKRGGSYTMGVKATDPKPYAERVVTLSKKARAAQC